MNILVTQKQNFTPKRVTPTCHQPTLNINMLPLFHSELLLSTFFYHVRFLQAIWREGIMPQEQKPRSRHGRDDNVQQETVRLQWHATFSCFNHYLFLKPSSKQEEEEKCIECRSSSWSRSDRMMFSHGFTCY